MSVRRGDGKKRKRDEGRGVTAHSEPEFKLASISQLAKGVPGPQRLDDLAKDASSSCGAYA